jgi:hypothetical protein
MTQARKTSGQYTIAQDTETVGREVADKRYGAKAAARELGGQSTKSNLAAWSEIARKNSYHAKKR